MKNDRTYTFLLLAALLLLLPACQESLRVSKTNLAQLYEPEKQFSNLEHWVFHHNDSASTLLVRVNYSSLVYRRESFSGAHSCSYSLSFRLKRGYEAGEILQASSVYGGDTLHYGQDHTVVHTFTLDAKYPEKYLLELNLTDNNRQSSSVAFVEIDKSTSFGRQNFMVIGSDGQLIFNPLLHQGEGVRVLTGNFEDTTLFVSYYDRDFPAARPPFVEDREPVFDFSPDSAFRIPLYQGTSEWLILPGPGFYHFRKDTLSREGLTLFSFSGDYPEITTAEQLSGPLRYITTRKEYDSIALSANIKAAVDDFWLRSAGSPERALTLLQKFYGYAEEANRYFSSYTEGWKTDRGLIYIVLGRPDYVYRGDGVEEWLYGEPQHRNSLRFTFVRVRNPFTDNDFMLLRSPTFKDPWYITVQSWRR